MPGTRFSHNLSQCQLAARMAAKPQKSPPVADCVRVSSWSLKESSLEEHRTKITFKRFPFDFEAQCKPLPVQTWGPLPKRSGDKDDLFIFQMTLYSLGTAHVWIVPKQG